MKLSKQKFTVYALQAALFVMTVSGGIVFGSPYNSDLSGDFICSNTGAFTDMVSLFVTLLMFGSVAAGALIWFVEKSTEAFSDGGIWIFEDGRQALISGIAAPFGLYLFQFLLDVVLGVDISCLTP